MCIIRQRSSSVDLLSYVKLAGATNAGQMNSRGLNFRELRLTGDTTRGWPSAPTPVVKDPYRAGLRPSLNAGVRSGICRHSEGGGPPRGRTWMAAVSTRVGLDVCLPLLSSAVSPL